MPRLNELSPVSAQRAAREELARQYGSYENYLKKLAHVASDTPCRKAFHEKVKQAANLEDLREALGAATPYWMMPFELAQLDLALIGSPENSAEWRADIEERTQRSKPPIGVTYRDYTILGWPRNAGAPVRMVTRWEHREIERRLRNSDLTKPGAEVPTVGKTLAEMIEDDEPVPGWIIEGILREGGAAMVYGPAGIGKTWFVHTLMLLATAGNGVGVHNPQIDRWLLKAGADINKRLHGGVKVCLIDGEMITADLADRAKLLCKALELHMIGNLQSVPPIDFNQLRMSLEKSTTPEDAKELAAAVCDREEAAREGTFLAAPQDGEEGPVVDLSKIVVYAKAGQDHRADFVDLANSEWKSRIVEFCKREEIKVLILDNLSTLSETLEDENDATRWNPLNALVVALKNEGIATILVHHSNKSDTGFRGSSNINTTLETVIKLERVEGAKAAGACFRVRFEKNRANKKPEADGKTFKLDEGHWISEVDLFDTAKQVVDMVNSLKYGTQAEIADELGVDQATVSRLFVTAVAQGHAREGDLQDTLKRARALRKQQAAPISIEPDEDEYDDAPPLDV